MKITLIFASLLLVLGCSSNWSTNPAGQEYETNATVQLSNDGEWISPVSDIEPGVPDCITNSYGFVEMQNPCSRPVTCRIDQGVPCMIFAGDDFTMQAGHGYHTLFWSGVNGVYEESVYIPLCDTTGIAYDQDQAHLLSVHK